MLRRSRHPCPSTARETVLLEGRESEDKNETRCLCHGRKEVGSKFPILISIRGAGGSLTVQRLRKAEIRNFAIKHRRAMKLNGRRMDSSPDRPAGRRLLRHASRSASESLPSATVPDGLSQIVCGPQPEAEFPGQICSAAASTTWRMVDVIGHSGEQRIYRSPANDEKKVACAVRFPSMSNRRREQRPSLEPFISTARCF